MTEMKDLSDVFKDMKDISDLEKFEFENAFVVRGKTPEDIEDQCLSLCQQYLAGNWLTQTKDTVKVTRIAGGFVNQLYYVKINEPNEEESVPQEVTIKFDGDITNAFENKRLKDKVIAMAFSDKGLGPKLYGVFDKGIIQGYYKHRGFYKKEHDNPAIVENVFRTLAHVNALDVPISKAADNQFPFGMADQLLAKAKKFDLKKEIQEYKCTELKNLDFDAEIKWFRDRISEVESPVVFTHNDYKSNNLLITEPNDDLIICDFDTAGYGYRGSEFVNLYREFGPGSLGVRFADMTPVEDFPVEEEIFGPLVALYVDECTKIHGKAFTDDPNNRVEHIIRETKFFWAYDSLCFLLMPLSSDINDKSEFFTFSRKIAMEMTNCAVKNYLKMKQLLIDNNVVLP